MTLESELSRVAQVELVPGFLLRVSESTEDRCTSVRVGGFGLGRGWVGDDWNGVHKAGF